LSLKQKEKTSAPRGCKEGGEKISVRKVEGGGANRGEEKSCTMKRSLKRESSVRRKKRKKKEDSIEE